METGQITLFYFIYFLRSNCLYHSFLNLKILKIHFHVVALWIVLACKTPQFLEKLPIQAAHHTFPERRHPEATKNLHYVLSTRRSQMPYFYAQAPRLLDMNISPCYLNPLYQKINTQPVPYSNLLSASKHGLHNLGFRFAFTLLSQLVTCKTVSFSSPLGLIEIWLICEVFRMPEKLYIRLANCSKRLL